MMGTVTITEFLLARIAEDEEGARAAATYSAQWSVGDEFNETVLLAADDGMGHTFDSVYGQVAPHIAKWDPARALTECKAKRRIVEDFVQYADDYQVAPSPFAEGRRHAALLAVTRVVEVYSDHPDFDPAWRA